MFVFFQYCFITGTYTVPDLDSNQLYAHHGVGTHIEGQTTQKFHHYFQWVPFILLFLGVIFRLPYLLWRFWEKQKLQSFLNIGQNEQGACSSKYFLTLLFLVYMNWFLHRFQTFIQKSFSRTLCTMLGIQQGTCSLLPFQRIAQLSPSFGFVLDDRLVSSGTVSEAWVGIFSILEKLGKF